MIGRIYKNEIRKMSIKVAFPLPKYAEEKDYALKISWRSRIM